MVNIGKTIARLMTAIDKSTDLALSRAFALLLFWPSARTPSFLTVSPMAGEWIP